MNCPQCNQPMTRGDRYWICERHDPPVFVVAEDAAHAGGPPAGSLADLVRELPHPLAVVLDEYVRESNPYIKLHRLCDATEMLARFLATVAIAEIVSVADGAEIPGPLRSAILERIERPTFGNWMGILNDACACLAPGERLLVPELQDLGKILSEKVGTSRDPIEDFILPLRNSLAHDPRFSVKQAAAFLDEHGHRGRFEQLWIRSEAEFLWQLELVGFDQEGSCRLLRGVPESVDPFPDYTSANLLTEGEDPPSWTPGMILLTREGKDLVLDLRPLQAFGPVLHRTDDRLEQVTKDAAAQVYARRTDRLLHYTALHHQAGHGMGDETMQDAFQRLFPLGDWREAIRRPGETGEADARLRDTVRYGFADVVKPLMRETFVGRDGELEAAVGWLEQNPSGVGLILGLPGMGKTAFAARLSVEIKRRHKDWLCLRHFFKMDDVRGTVREFMQGVLLQLQREGARAGELPDDTHEAQQAFLEGLAVFSQDFLGEGRRYGRLVLVLDGMDEIAQRDGRFFELVRARRMDRVMWMCLGRPEPAVLAGLPESSADRLSLHTDRPDQPGLGPLDGRAVREYLLEELGRRRYEFLAEEDDLGESAFVEALADQARRLPLYLHLLVEDLRAGRFRFDRPAELPDSLEAYYGALMDRLALDAARKVLPDVISLLAVAYTPLTDDMLASLLADHDLRADPDWKQMFDRSLRLGHTLMRSAHLWEGRTGHTLYHQTFRDFLLAGESKGYDEFRMAPVLRKARQRILELCRKWSHWPPDSDERRYAITYGPRHFTQACQWDDVECLLTDISFLEAKTAAGMVFELATDFAAAAAALPEAYPLRRILRPLEAAVRREISFVGRHAGDYPQGIFQCLWNNAWWYDCPEAGRHYRHCNSGTTAPWDQGGTRLWRLVESWRGAKTRLSDGLCWLRALRPPPVHLRATRGVFLRGQADLVTTVAFSADCRQVAGTLGDRTVRVWDAGTGQQLLVLRGHEDRVNCVAFSLDSRLIASASDDKTVRVWDATTGSQLMLLHGHQDRVTSVDFSPDGQRIVSAGAGLFGRDNTIRVWDAATGVPLADLRGHEDNVNSVAFSLDNRRIASASDDKTVRIWDAATGNELMLLRAHQDRVTSVAFSPDGQRIVSAGAGFLGRDNTIQVWDAQSGAELAVWRGHESGVTTMAFSPDGQRIVSAGAGFLGRDNTIRVWDAATGVQLECLNAHGERVYRVAFTREGLQIASSPDGRSVRVWDAAEGSQLLVLRGHDKPITAVVFSPDGLRIASGSEDCTVRVWDAVKGEELAILLGDEESVTTVAFSSDGQRIVSKSRKNRVRAWDAASGECLEVTEDGSDVPANATGTGPPHLWHAVGRGRETVVEPAGGGDPVASFPLAITNIAAHPNGRVWAGSVANHLYILSLEGDLEPAHPTTRKVKHSVTYR